MYTERDECTETSSSPSDCSSSAVLRRTVPTAPPLQRSPLSDPELPVSGLDPEDSTDLSSETDPEDEATVNEVLKPKSAMAEEREWLLAQFHPSRLQWKNADWVVFFWMLSMHIGTAAAIIGLCVPSLRAYTFSWPALATACVLHWFTASIGICLGYHRGLSHRSFVLSPIARFVTLMAGAISGEGSPLMWAASHRLHHAHSDETGDPHSPLINPWWSHIMWLFIEHPASTRETLFRHFVPDLAKDPLLRFFERTYGLWLIGTGAILFAVGGLPMLLWAMCLRMTLCYHSTWFVNSATHLWGYRNYDTTDASRNLWWVAIAAYGEGWHNNHHAHPRVARAGHRWWEIDMTWYAIRTLQMLGLATKVVDKIPEGRDAAVKKL